MNTVVNQTPVVLDAAALKAGLSRKVGDSLAALVVDFPNMPTLRGVILRDCGKYVPDDVPATGIASWLLAALDEPAKATTPRYHEFPASCTETIYGTARYSATATYSGNVRISDEDLREILEGAADFSDAVDRLREAITEDNLSDMEYQGAEDYSYDDHEAADSEGRDWEIESVSPFLRAYIREHPDLDPERDEHAAEDFDVDEDDEHAA